MQGSGNDPTILHEVDRQLQNLASPKGVTRVAALKKLNAVFHALLDRREGKSGEKVTEGHRLHKFPDHAELMRLRTATKEKATMVMSGAKLNLPLLKIPDGLELQSRFTGTVPRIRVSGSADMACFPPKCWSGVTCISVWDCAFSSTISHIIGGADAANAVHVSSSVSKAIEDAFVTAGHDLSTDPSFRKHADLWKSICGNPDLKILAVANGTAKEAYDFLKAAFTSSVATLSGLEMADAFHFLALVARHLVMQWQPLPSLPDKQQPTTSLVSPHHGVP